MISRIRTLFPVLGAALAVFAAGEQGGGLPLLTQAGQVQKLSRQEVARGYPLRITGVVTYVQPDAGFYLQDASGGIYVVGKWQGVVSFGQRVRVEGKTVSGSYASDLQAERVRPLGPGKLPPPVRYDPDDFVNGRRAGLWGEFAGTVEEVVPRSNGDPVELLLNDHGHRYRARVQGLSVADARRLVDAELRLRGVCGTVVNKKYQFMRARIAVQNPQLLRVVRPAPADPFAGPARSIASLLRYSAEEPSPHRVKVEGTVVWKRGAALAIMQGSDGMFVNSGANLPLHSGDQVAVVGFLGPGEYNPQLRNALCRKIGTDAPPHPPAVSAADLLKGDFEATLVEIGGTLRDRVTRTDEEVLVVRSGNLFFDAVLNVPRGSTSPRLADLHPGAELRLTGVCAVETRGQGTPKAFRLLLRSTRDAVVTRQAPWWDVQRALAAMALLALLGAIGLFFMRRRIRSQTVLIGHRERQYQELFEHANDLIFATSANGRITAWNRAAERTLGYSAEEARQMELAEMVAPEGRAAVRAQLAELLQGGASRTCELQMVAKSGHTLFVDVNWRRSSRGGAPEGTQAIARDMTAHKRRLGRETQRRRAMEMIAADQPLEAVLEQVALLLEHQDDRGRCAIYLLRAQSLAAVAGNSAPREMVEAAERAPVGPLAGAEGAAAYWGKRMLVTDVAADPLCDGRQEAALAAGVRSCWAAPVHSATGRLQAVVAVYYAERVEPGAAGAEALDSACSMVAVAMERRQLYEQLDHQAHYDALTGLPNRRLFEDRLKHALSAARRSGESVGLLFIDLDRFKLINDVLGHSAGDGLLQEVARRLQGALRESDTVARMGGDEFTVVLGGLHGPSGASLVAAKLLDLVRAPFDVQGNELFVTASVGISVYPQDGADVDTLKRKADAAMYRAKGRGRNSLHCFAPELDGLDNRLEMENQLHHALERGEFQLAYQPQYELLSGRLVGMESLLRWRNARLGDVPPADFIPVAEETGLIVPIGEWVLNQACAQSQAWCSQGLPPLRMAVNVSAVQFTRAGFVRSVAQALEDHDLEPRLLELELTESTVMRDVQESASQLASLRQLGVRISIDDFGTGQSSLSYLRRLEVDALKIDRSFVQEIEDGSAPPSLVQAVVMMAHCLGIQVVAEGVETDRQLDTLRGLGCDQAQGYLLGKPLSAKDAGALLEQPGTGAPPFAGSPACQSRAV